MKLFSIKTTTLTMFVMLLFGCAAYQPVTMIVEKNQQWAGIDSTKSTVYFIRPSKMTGAAVPTWYMIETMDQDGKLLDNIKLGLKNGSYTFEKFPPEASLCNIWLGITKEPYNYWDKKKYGDEMPPTMSIQLKKGGKYWVYHEIGSMSLVGTIIEALDDLKPGLNRVSMELGLSLIRKQNFRYIKNIQK